MGVPKTIDNDLWGQTIVRYGSAARYIATSIGSLSRCPVYDQGMITILEIMGRNAGWLTASAALAANAGFGPDLIYSRKYLRSGPVFADVNEVYRRQNNVMIAVSRESGIRMEIYLEYGRELAYKDSFGHVQLGGLAPTLVNLLREKPAPKFGVLSSVSSKGVPHLGSQTDVYEAALAGQMAVRYAVEGKTDYMVAFEREDGPEYKCKTKLVKLEDIANKEKKIPGNGLMKLATA